MFSPRSGRKPDDPLTVHVPPLAEDRPSWAKVAVLAAMGFVIGVAWPRLAGVRLGPSAPEAGSSAANASAPAAETVAPALIPAPSPAPPTPGVGSAPVAAVALTPTPAAAPETAAAGLTVSRGFVFACKGSDGESFKGSQCGKLPGLDAVVQPRLRSLEECAATAKSTGSGFAGKAHLVVRADFGRGTLTAEFGRSQGPDAPEALLACVRTSLSGASLQGLAHDHPSYALAYTLALGAPSSPAASVSAPSSSRPLAAGASAGTETSSQVVWDVALVRDAPRTGTIVARLQRGTPVRLGTSKDGWYPIKFGDGFSSDGWVFRGAVGR